MKDEKRTKSVSAGELSPREKTPPGTLAKRLGNGEGAQKLAYVFFLVDYDDELAYFLADVGAIIAGADQVVRKKGKLRTEEERVILSKAARLRSVLQENGARKAKVRQ